ncbi:alpha/beta fold hydrolase [Bradyrhizobium erythrophlei]|uniref:Pimeloyl-ACP methyl ester carboxylesterase n=1 Tax=Bradyrhizobium erythrophlei TaxID=1437360 RepID=A0A1H4WS35_9BRAD|nr:alpha/beta hydrolase [Bradyrhizobium erythrophlei]SEC96157.1 Pimeloyl-ACP methyl ester carboxylesterase [Bradyrhizobium erythrophlei]
MDFTSLFHNTPIRTVDVDGAPVAYRTFGPESGTPLVMQQRFRGSMDDWDPALIATLAKERRLVVWDNTGIGFSGGSVQGSITEMAKTAASFIDALAFNQVDLLGFSVGGYITQRLALLRPGLVRNIILAGTGPGGGEGATYPGPEIEYWVKPGHPLFEVLKALWYNDTLEGRAATRAYMDRIYHDRRPARADVTNEAGLAQRAAIVNWWKGGDATLPELERIRQPVLVVNGNHDVMVPTPNTFLMAQKLPNAQLIIYPNSGHGALFQYYQTFSAHVLQFLKSQEEGGIR